MAYSGGGWSHRQRPDPSGARFSYWLVVQRPLARCTLADRLVCTRAGRHICMFANTASVSNISILNNIFFQTQPYQAGWWMDNAWGNTTNGGWGGSIREDGNVWWQSRPDLGMLAIFGRGARSYSAANFSTLYRSLTGNGAHSLVVDPLLSGLLKGATLTNVTDMRPIGMSPVIDAGQPTIWATDYDGTTIGVAARGRPNIGAFQRVSEDEEFNSSDE
jgi:hypothetical protein